MYNKVIKISEQTSREQFLNELAKEAQTDSQIYIEAESLPSFISTTVAVEVLTYQLLKYPKELNWWSDSLSILEVMDQAKLKINTFDLDKLRAWEIEKKRAIQQKLQKEAEIKNRSLVPTQTSTITIPSETPNYLPNYKPKSTPALKKPVKFGLKPTENKPKLVNNFFPSGAFNLGRKTHQTPNSINTQNIFKSDSYQPSSLLNLKNKVVPPDPASLIGWVQKIENTQQALERLKNKKEEKTFWELVSEKINLNLSPVWQKGIFGVSFFLFVVILVFAFNSVFPKIVYSVQISNLEANQSIDLKINKTEFVTIEKELKQELQTQTSGFQEKQLSRSVGKVFLVNESKSDVVFDKEGLVLVSDGNLEYRQLANSSDPSAFRVPAGTSQTNNPIQITIQASGDGSEYNLKKDTKLEIFNLKKQSFSANTRFYAIVQNEIKNTQTTGKKVVSEADKSLLRSQCQSGFVELRAREIQKIATSDTITSPKWFEHSNIEYKFNLETGQESESLNVSCLAKTKLYYLQSQTLVNLIKNENLDILEVKDLELADTLSDLSKNESFIQVKFFYSYIKNQFDCQDKLKDYFQQDNNQNNPQAFENTKTRIKKECSDIVEINKTQTGLNWFGLTPIQEIKILQNNS